MVTGIDVSAPLGTAMHWNQINWLKCEAHTRKLQARIVQATQQERWNKVKALQHLLTRSFSAKALAVKRITTNKGKNTPGIDGQVWQSLMAKSQGIAQLRHHGYRSQPLKRVYIPKLNGDKRILGIPTFKDRAMQALYLMGLEPVAETTGDQHSYGFRPHRSTADAISQIFCTLSRSDAPQWILEIDIRKCFDEINHAWLMEHVVMEKKILSQWLKAGFIEKRKLYPTERGTPQGGIISPTLANLTLDGLEDVLEHSFGKKGSKKRKASGVHMIRYADDLVITGKTRTVLEDQVMRLLETFLRPRGLEMSLQKTKISHINEGFDFLSQTVRKYQKKLIIQPSKKSTKRLLERVRRLIHKNRSATQTHLINVLTPQIRGWAYYHRHVCSRKTFERVDHETFRSLWLWSKRRHRNKGAGWIKSKYFEESATRQWCFAPGKCKSTAERVTLFQATNVPIRRRVKIKADANPFDTAWKTYFQQRQRRGTIINKMSDNLEVNPSPVIERQYA